MSWFQSANIANLAKSALKEAQKTIDKALDIREDEATGATTSVTEVASDFFASWGVAVGTKNSNSISKDSNGQIETSILEGEEQNEEDIHNSTTFTTPPVTVLDNNHLSKMDEITTKNNLMSEIFVELVAAPTTTTTTTKINFNKSSTSLTSQIDDSTDDTKFQSLWLLTDSDSFESSIDTSNSYNKIECLDEDSTTSTIELTTSSSSSKNYSVLSSSSNYNSNSKQSLIIQDDDSLTLVPINFDHEDESNDDTIVSDLIDISDSNNTNNLDDQSISTMTISQEYPQIQEEDNNENKPSCSSTSTSTSAEFILLEPQKNLTQQQIHSIPHQESFGIQMHEDDEDGLRTPYNQGQSLRHGHDGSHTCTTNNTLPSQLLGIEYTHENNKNDTSLVPISQILDIDNDEKFSEILPGPLLSPPNNNNKIQNINNEGGIVEPSLHFQSSQLLSSPDSKQSSETSSEPDLSNKSISSRATSSISVISEEKESISISSRPSTPISGETENEIDTRTSSSPSFEVISIHSSSTTNGNSSSRKHLLLDHGPGGGNNSNNSGGSSSSGGGHGHGHNIHPQHNNIPHPPHGNNNGNNNNFDLTTCHSISSMSMSMIPNSQSVSVTSTPQSHSRSNSNTSSSFDRIEDHRPRSETRSHQNFVSSTSSSDIEVIPLDSVDIIRQRVVSVHEVETQTDVIPEVKDTLPQPPQQPVVGVIPTKIIQILSEKDAEILQLREEGEKLSKKQFDLSTIIKKLRLKEKENENNVKGLKLELITNRNEIDRLMKSFIHKEGLEQSQNETIGKINQENRKLECLVDQLKSDLEDAKENTSSMKSSLEDASIEILELQNSLATVQHNTAEMDILTKDKSELIQQNDILQRELNHLRTVINLNQNNNSTKELELKQQINNLSLKVHHFENEISNISSDIADATSPLSYEIEKLQLEIKSKEHRYEKNENTFIRKINELELKIKNGFENEKSFKDERNTLQDIIDKLETQMDELITEKNTINQQYENVLDDKNITIEKLSTFKIEYNEMNEQLKQIKNDIIILQNDLKNEKNLLNIETKKNQNLIEQLNKIHQSNNSGGNKQQQQQQQHHSGENSPSNSIISEASYLEEVFDSNGTSINHHHHHNNSISSMTPKFFESFSSMNLNLFDNYQIQLRQREMELLQFQDEVCKNEKIRKTLNDEIAHLTVQNQELLMQMDKMNEIQSNLNEVQKNYNAILQMYGEKVEEADELRMDLEDVKEMYKLQIEQLLKKS